MPPEDGAGPPSTRLGDADRERLAATLGRHYVDGRLTADELGERLDLVYAAGTREQAADAVAGLPTLSPPAGRRRRGRRHGEADAPDPAWVPTTERFVDPSSGRVMRVWVDPVDARRHYVADAPWG